MAFPTFTSEVAFSTDPFAAVPSWEDVSDDRIRLSLWAAGRQSEFDRVERAVSVLVLDNNDRTYDPTNAASTHHPNLVPRRRIRHKAALNAVTYDLFDGFVDDDGFPQPWELPNYAETPVRAFDYFAELANTYLPEGTTAPEELSGARLNRYLDLISFPAGDRAIDDGKELIQAAAAGDLDGKDLLSLIFDVTDTEPGAAFMDGQRRFVFHDRHHRLAPPFTTSQATFSDDPSPGEFPYARLRAKQSEIVNAWRITRQGGVEQVAEDQASIDRYGRNERPVSTLHTSDSRALAMGQFLLARTKDPYDRFEEMVVEPLDDSDLWAQALGRAVPDRITVKRTPPGGGAQTVKQVNIEAAVYDFVPLTVGVASVTWRLSPADKTNYWYAGVSVLGVDTIPVF